MTPAFDFESDVALLTDLYELTMCASYHDQNRNELATFDLFVRKLPPNRSYYLFAGLEQALLYLEHLRFSQEHIHYLRKQGFKQGFLSYLKDFEFSGEVWAVPEGTVVFPNEPLIRITAPVIEAQLVESFLLNTVNLQTMLATKASRVVQAAKGRSVIEFGLRRTQGADAGMKAARCSYIAGANGTSNVLAGMKYGIPIFGTMAHSFVMFFDNELEAFRAFTETFPNKSTLLIDTYNNAKGAKNAGIVAKELEKRGFHLGSVRLDSGDLVEVSRKVRSLLDAKGLSSVKILASGDLDEYKIEKLISRGARIDAFGVGTRMSTSEDKPYVDIIYKLCEKMEKNGELHPAMKLSQGKITLPARKQVHRIIGENGRFVKDIVAIHDEDVEGEPLLFKVMENGRITYRLPTIDEVRKNASENVSRLPEKYKRLERAFDYPVQLSPRLRELVSDLSKELKRIEAESHA